MLFFHDFLWYPPHIMWVKLFIISLLLGWFSTSQLQFFHKNSVLIMFCLSIITLTNNRKYWIVYSSVFFFLSQFCDVAQVRIIIICLTKVGDLQNMKIENHVQAILLVVSCCCYGDHFKTLIKIIVTTVVSKVDFFLKLIFNFFLI